MVIKKIISILLAGIIASTSLVQIFAEDTGTSGSGEIITSSGTLDGSGTTDSGALVSDSGAIIPDTGSGLTDSGTTNTGTTSSGTQTPDSDSQTTSSGTITDTGGTNGTSIPPIIKSPKWSYNIFLGDEKIATVETQSGTSKTIFHLNDHLGGSNIDTDSTGEILQIKDYMPFGKERISQKNSDYTNKYGFIGKEKDIESGLNYVEARYYDSPLGRFISQDPVFWEIGQTKRGTEIISDPQQLNSYSYSRNNPLVYKDAGGENPIMAAIGVALTIVGIAYTANYFHQEMMDNLNKGEIATAKIYGAATIASPLIVRGGEKILGWIGGKIIGKATSKINFSRLEYHFEKHGAEFGAKTSSEYAQKASDFLNKKITPNIQQWIRARDGATIRIDEITKNVGIKKDGEISTFYKLTEQTIKDFITKNK